MLLSPPKELVRISRSRMTEEARYPPLPLEITITAHARGPLGLEVSTSKEQALVVTRHSRKRVERSVGGKSKLPEAEDEQEAGRASGRRGK